jgi:hypothetical protein
MLSSKLMMNPPSTKSGSGALSIVTVALLDEFPVVLLTAGPILKHFHFCYCVTNSASQIKSNSILMIIFFPLMLLHFRVNCSLRIFNTAIATSTRYFSIMLLAWSWLFLLTMTLTYLWAGILSGESEAINSISLAFTLYVAFLSSGELIKISS